MTFEEQFLAHLDLVERVLRFISRKNFLSDTDAEEFSASARMKLIEDDYAILRKFEGKSSLSTYLTVVLQRLYFDYRNQLWGRWRPSAAAKRLGQTAIQLECALHRDGKSFDEAFERIRTTIPISRDELDALHRKLPPRSPRAATVGLDDVEIAIEPQGARGIEEREAMKVASAADRVMIRISQELDAEDRILLKMRFADAIPIVDIARALHLEPRVLYKRIERLLGSLRRRLEAEGLDRDQLRTLFELRPDLLFGEALWGNLKSRPSIEEEQAVGEGLRS